jgi:hypothetical protein
MKTLLLTLFKFVWLACGATIIIPILTFLIAGHSWMDVYFSVLELAENDKERTN